MTIYNRSKGVTLIELSIVLAILGVLIIATISGRSLIEISRATATMQHLRDRNIAFSNFVNVYGCLPGDCYDATTKLENLFANTNGNGNGLIQFSNSGAPNAYEMVYVEYHLVAAKLFNRSIIQVNPVTGNGTLPTQNKLVDILPKAKIPDAYISSLTISGVYGQDLVYSVIGKVSTSAINSIPVDYNIARIVDTKTDNSNPTTGNVVCATSVSGSVTYVINSLTFAASYNTDCALISRMDL